MNPNLLILGAGQLGRMVREIALQTERFSKIDFLDDHNEAAIGALSEYRRLLGEYDCAVVAIGDPGLRLEWIERLDAAGVEIETLVSPRAYVSPSADLGKGCIIEPLAIIQTEASVAKGVIVSSGAVVRHNAVVGEGCHLDCNCVVMSDANVPRGTKVLALSCYKGEAYQKRNIGGEK